MEQLKYNLFRAYYDARKNKRNTINQLRFEIEYEKHLWELYEEIFTQTYEVGRSIAFIVNKPVKREIFAADFRDRVIHHLLYNYIAPIVEPYLISDAYSCRVGRGTSFGIKKANEYMQKATQSYTQNAYVMKLDIQGYFMSINKDILFDKVIAIVTPQAYANFIKVSNGGDTKEDMPYELLLYLLKKVIYNDPVKNCLIKSPSAEWDNLPASKSLFEANHNCGLPIGNLTSQLFSNIYLADFDKYLTEDLGMAYYGRYVDDFFMMHQCKTTLLLAKNKCAKYLRRRLQLVLHPKKIYLQTCANGFPFLGVYIKPNRIYIGKRTKASFKKCVYAGADKEISNNQQLQMQWRDSINSYLGLMKHYNTYALRHKTFLPIVNEIQFGVFNHNFTKLNLNNVTM